VYFLPKDCNESEGFKDISQIAFSGFPTSELEIVSKEEDRERNIRRYSLSRDNILFGVDSEYPYLR
jgi:hypothetical protein